MTEIKLYSFDVFDTLITRKVATPDGIFVLMQDSLINDARFSDIPLDVKENFYVYRKDAIWYQRRLQKTLQNYDEVSFDNIYNHFKKTFNLSQEQVEILKNLEVEIEINNVVPIKVNIEKIKKLLEENKKVVLISDMYLPKKVIEEMLKTADPIFEKIELYLSSDIKKMKESGEAFIYVKNKEGISYENWQHIGDNKKNDYLNAKRLGIKAELYEYVELESYEKKALKELDKSSIVQLSIGASKNLRLNKFSGNLKAQFGASLAAPILYPYVFWVLEQAVKRNIKHLFFIARDCYIPFKMAEEIIKILNYDISVSYFYGSRKAWLNAGVTVKDKLLKQNLISYYTGAGCKELENRCELTEKELLSILPVKFHAYKKGFNPSLKEDFLNYLLEDDTLLNYINDKFSKKKLEVKRYFEQSISFLNGNKFAFVEIDGSGLTNSCFVSAIDALEKVESFYYFMTPRVYESNKVNYNYFSSIRYKGGNYIAEMLVRAPHGQTLGYKNNNNIWVPILEDIDTTIFKKWEYEKYLEGILVFTKNAASYYNAKKRGFSSNQYLANYYIDYLINSVDKKTVRVLIPMNNRFQCNVISDEFAPEITIFQAIKYLLGYKLKSDNLTYSILRSRGVVKQIFDFKNKYFKKIFNKK